MAYPEGEDQRILLADFGIARWTNDVSGLTATNMTVGTVSYAPPEQLMGQDLDGRADQYALAATAFHLLTGSPPFTHSNPAVVISQHLSASPPALGERRPELSRLDPVLAKALAKDPKDRFERCADFARALRHRLEAAPPTDVGGTRPAAAAKPRAPESRSLLRVGVIVPAVLAVLLIAAVLVAIMEFRRAEEPEASAPPPAMTVTTPTTVTTPAFTPLPAPPEPVTPPAAVIGANCSPVGSTATTAEGATAYCSRLQTTGASIWSVNPGDVPSPTVTTGPTEQPLPIEEESPVRVCMQQTGRTLLQCREMIRRSNLGGP
jgi:serine/threonine-protein kinase